MFQRWLCISLTVASAWAAGCKSRPAPGENPPQAVQARQLETLETIAALEAEAAALAASYREVASARVYIRPRSAIVLLSAAGDVKIERSTIEGINRYITENTGLMTHQIIMKRVTGKGDER